MSPEQPWHKVNDAKQIFTLEDFFSRRAIPHLTFSPSSLLSTLYIAARSLCRLYIPTMESTTKSISERVKKELATTHTLTQAQSKEICSNSETSSEIFTAVKSLVAIIAKALEEEVKEKLLTENLTGTIPAKIGPITIFGGQ